MVTKSGGNSITASAYAYRRDDSLNSENFFGQKPGDKTQAGFTGGGPIIKNKFFAFGGYEGLRTTAGRTLLGSVPNPVLLSGDFSLLGTPITDPLTGAAFPGNIIPADRFSNFAKTLGPTIPPPNLVGANNLRVVKSFNDDADTADVRLDQVLSSKHSLFERYLYYNGRQTNPSLFSFTDFPQRGQNLAVGETWVISPAVVNETRVGYNYAYHLNAPISLDGRNWVADIGLQNLAGGVDPIDYGRPGFTMTGFSGNGEGGITQGATEKMLSVSNATSWVKGRHNVRFGLQAQFRQFDHLTEVPPRGGFTFNGQYTGNPVADFLLGYCSTCTGAFGSSRSTYHSPTFAPFFDDNWQISSALTLQMGIRWEYLGPWEEENGIEGSFDAATGKIAYHKLPANLPPQLVPLVIQQDDFYPAGILKKDLNNWGPRVGLAYNVNDQTVARTGFGVYYDNLNLNELQFSRLVPPYYGQYSLQPTATDLGFNADTLFPDLNNIPQFPAPFSMDPSNRSAYTVQWNANVQRSLGRNYLVEVAYTGSRSYNEHKRYNINQAAPGTTPIVTRVPYPAFQSAILYSSDAGWARFNGLSFRVEKRYSDGLFFLGNYQISKSTDNGSGEIEANDTAFATEPGRRRGTGTLRPAASRRDQRRLRIAVRPGQALAVGRRRGRLLLGGWQVQGIIRVGIGVPVLGDVDQRLPVRLVRPAARELCARTRGGRRQHRQPHFRSLVRPDRVSRAGARHAGHRRPQHRARPGYPARRLLAQQAVPNRQGARRVPVGGLQPVQPRELRHARSEHLESHGRHDHDCRRRTQHAVRAAVRLVAPAAGASRRHEVRPKADRLAPARGGGTPRALMNVDEEHNEGTAPTRSDGIDDWSHRRSGAPAGRPGHTTVHRVTARRLYRAGADGLQRPRRLRPTLRRRQPQRVGRQLEILARREWCHRWRIDALEPERQQLYRLPEPRGEGLHAEVRDQGRRGWRKRYSVSK